jgi:tripartite-type tricarboxylate transporter receptor subunit TctC
VHDRKIRILVQYTAARNAQMPDIPTMVELGRSDEARQILSFYASAAEVGRSIVAPPAMSPQTVATLRRGFDAMLADPIFLEDGKRIGIPLKPMSGERLQNLIGQVGSFPPSLIAKARQAREKPN